MAALQLDLLGGFQLRDDAGTVLTLSNKKAKALLAYLSLHAGEAHSRDKLASLLWEDRNETLARHNLRQVLTSLRKVPGLADGLQADVDSVMLAPDFIASDVLQFEHLHSHTQPAELSQAVALYQGDFMEGFNPRSFSFEDWLMEQRHRLRENALSAMNRLLAHYLASDEPASATTLALRLVALDPLQEPVHRTLMTLYARSGRLAAALKQYRICRGVLARELGVAPEAQTEQLYRDIYQQRRQPATTAPEPVPAATNTQAGSRPTQAEARPLPAATTSGLVGRRQEQRLFVSALDACQELACGQAFLLRGEAGIGKTRLVEEYRRLARTRGFSDHQALVLDFGGQSGYDALADLLRSVLQLPAVTAAEQVRSSAARLLGADTPEQQALLIDLLGLPQAPDLRALFDAMDNTARRHGKHHLLNRIVGTLSQQQPLLLIVEDIHWADAMTLHYLAQLAAAVSTNPALLVLTSRVEGEPLDPDWRGMMQGAALTTLDLGPLAEDEARALAQQFPHANAAFVQRCIARAAGNPLFLAELLRTADDDDAAAPHRVPDSVSSLVQSRLERLPPADRQAAQAAAVLGQRFELATLRALLDQPDYHCGNLLTQRLLRPDGEAYLFSHALILDGIYNSLPLPRRCALHGKAAEWFQPRDPIRYAEHLERAEDKHAASAFLHAASVQAKAYHFERAQDLLARGLRLTNEPQTRFELLCLQGELAYASGETAASLNAYQQALDYAETRAQRCRAQLGSTDALRILDRYEEALQALEQACQQAENEAEHAQMHYLRGSILFPLGQIEACQKAHSDALAAARRAAIPQLEAKALSGLADAYYLQGRMVSAYRYFDQCIALCREHGLLRIEPTNLAMRGLTRFFQNDLTGGLADSEQAAALAARIGDQRGECIARNILTDLHYFHGDYVSASTQASQCLQLSRRIGSKRAEVDNLYMLGLSRITRDPASDGLALIKQAYTLSQEHGVLRYNGPMILGTWALAARTPAQRRWALDEGERLLSQGCVGHNYLYFYAFAIEITLRDSQWDEAERYADALRAYTASEPVPWSDFISVRARTMAAFGRGQRNPTITTMLQRLQIKAQTVGLQLDFPGF